MTDASKVKNLRDCQHDAVMLHGLLRGLDVLQNNDTERDAREGIVALIDLAKEKAGILSEDLDRLEGALRAEAAQQVEVVG